MASAVDAELLAELCRAGFSDSEAVLEILSLSDMEPTEVSGVSCECLCLFVGL